MNPGAPRDERAHDVVLGAHVHQQHFRSVLRAVVGWRLRHHLLEDLAMHFDRRSLLHGVGRLHAGVAEHAAHRPDLP